MKKGRRNFFFFLVSKPWLIRFGARKKGSAIELQRVVRSVGAHTRRRRRPFSSARFIDWLPSSIVSGGFSCWPSIPSPFACRPRRYRPKPRRPKSTSHRRHSTENISVNNSTRISFIRSHQTWKTRSFVSLSVCQFCWEIPFWIARRSDGWRRSSFLCEKE